VKLVLGVLVVLSACRAEPAPAPLPWARLDLSREAFAVETGEPVTPKISFLGSAEVRDMSLVPASQLAAFPRRTAGQVQALEMKAGSRARWPVRLGRDGYFSFTPLGSEGDCPCIYRVGIRSGSAPARELFRIESAPVGPIAPPAVEVDLSDLSGPIELLLQLDGPPGSAALWGSPAVYFRSALPRKPASGRPNILLVGLDTFRADALGRNLTPNLDRLAGQSDVWLDAFTVFNSTNPSFVSMMTGLYGKSHGIYDLRTPLPRSHVTLAEHLAGAGYDTFAVISASHLGDHASGLGQGFREIALASEHLAAELAVDTTLDWIAGRQGKRPFFAWLHLFDPHTPHTPPQPYSLGFRPAFPAGLDPVRAWVPFREPGPRTFVEPVLGGQRDLYDGEVAYLDRQIGRLLAFLESRGMLEDTILVVVADHGESLGEHGILFRHAGLHDTTTHVPLMIRWPNRQGRRIEGLVQTIDLFPTILRAAGLRIPPQDGQDLEKTRRAVFAEHSDHLGAMVRTRDFKYIQTGPELYDLKTNPRETKNLAGRGLAVERELADLLRQWLANRRPHPEARPVEPSDEEKARLRALGYV
jgi:arylsulfatase A-like enzyme